MMTGKLLSDFARHLKVLQALSDSSVNVYLKKINEFLDWLTAQNRPHNNVTRRDLEDYLEACFYKGNSNATRLSKLTAIKKYFRYLIYAGIVQEDPTEEIPRPRRRKKFIQMFTKNEILRIFAAIDIKAQMGLRDAVIFILAVFCGLRAGEISGLALQDIIDVGKSLDVHVTGKFGKERQVYLWKVPSDYLRQWLALRMSQHARAADPLIISYRRGGRPQGHRLALSMLDRICKRYAQLAGIQKPKISMHMFRATHANDLRSVEGYDTPAIAERLGHENIATTDNYISTRGRIHKTYPSLAAYWREFNTIWRENNGDDPGGINA